MKIALFGFGKMGRLIAALAEKQGDSFTVMNRFSPIDLSSYDVCIDFSYAEGVLSHLELAASFKKPIVIGTTGWDDQLDTAKQIVKQAGIGAIYSPNFSLGIALFSLIVEKAASLFSSFPQYDVAGVEYHHVEKKDAPSGTAKALAQLFDGNLSFSSVRCGKFPGTHTILFDSGVDTITLTHEAKNREGFVEGALLAAKWIINNKGWWTFHDMVRSLYSSDHSFQRGSAR